MLYFHLEKLIHISDNYNLSLKSILYETYQSNGSASHNHDIQCFMMTNISAEVRADDITNVNKTKINPTPAIINTSTLESTNYIK